MINRVSLAFCLIATVQSKSGQDVMMVCNNLLEIEPRLRDEYGNFLPTWESLDSRELPEWYQDAKIGILVHWGVYSVPSFGSEWFWNHWKTETDSRKFRNFMEKNYKPGFAYQDFAHDFTAEFYNATEWVELFKASGAKYVVLTSKYHDGYTLWPSKYSINWNSMDVGPHRDLIGELADAVRANSDLRFGLYHSLIEWYNPLWLEDSKNNFTTDKFVLTKVLPEMYEIVEKYRPEIFWSDGDQEAPDSYWKSEEFIAYLYNESPVKDSIVVNDRWGNGTACQHGDFYTCADRYNPGHLLSHKWENAMTLDKISRGYRRNAMLEDYMTTAEMIAELASTVSCGGNILINVGPTKDGIIHPIFQDRLRELGKWLKVNGEAIYNTWPRHTQNDTLTGDIWYTVSNDIETIYAIVLTWPEDNVLQLGAMRLWKDYTFFLLGYPNKLKWRRMKDRIGIDLPLCGHRGQPAWVVKIKFKSRSNN